MLGAIIGGAVGLGSTLAGAFSNKNNNKFNAELAKQQNEWNQQAAAQQNEYNLGYQQNEFTQNQQQADKEYERNLAMWHLQNEYNTPSQQMARYQAAGLNPNLIYGNGSSSAGMASSPPAYQAARYTAPKAERAVATRAVMNPVYRNNIDPFQAISVSNQLAIQAAQKKQIDAQTSSIEQNTKNSAIDELIKAVELGGTKLNYDIKTQLKQVTIDQANELLRKTTAETANLYHLADNIQARTNLTENQLYKLGHEIQNLKATTDLNRWRLELSKLGLSDRDDFWTRLASRIIMSDDNMISRLLQRLGVKF